MAKKNVVETKDVTLNEVELNKIAVLQQKRAAIEQQARNALGGIDEQLKDTLELIGSYHDIDLINGNFRIEQGGRVVPVEESDPQPQQLNG